jgi:hypothetical protein
MHIILIHSIQNSCITYSTQKQHFAEMFTYSDNTNYNLNFYNFIVSFNLFEISFIRQLFICVWGQWWPRWNFRVLSTAPITAPSFDETSGICAIVAVVECRVLRARETTARGECNGNHKLWTPTFLNCQAFQCGCRKGINPSTTDHLHEWLCSI